MTGCAGIARPFFIYIATINTTTAQKMENLVIIACVLFAFYVAAAVFIFREVPPSISDTFYLYNNLVPDLGYIFTGFMFTEALLMLPPMVQLGSFEWWQFLGYLCPVGIGFCGAAPLFKDDKMVKKVHFAGAISAVVTGLIWCLLLNFSITVYTLGSLILFCCVVADYTDTANKCSTFWLEMIGFGSIALVLLITYTM